MKPQDKHDQVCSKSRQSDLDAQSSVQSSLYSVWVAPLAQSHTRPRKQHLFLFCFVNLKPFSQLTGGHVLWPGVCEKRTVVLRRGQCQCLILFKGRMLLKWRLLTFIKRNCGSSEKYHKSTRVLGKDLHTSITWCAVFYSYLDDGSHSWWDR